MQTKRELRFYNRVVKRGIDILLATVISLLLLPLLIILILAIKLDSKGPVLFRQRRIGLNKKEFEILKFRTMRIDAPHDVPTNLLTDPNQYITRMGRFLRKTSMDELPQLWNILIGQMSFVGPRPALWNQYELIAARDRFRANQVRPGLTGWAQINGRDELDDEEKARYDGEYVAKLSFWFDLKCFFGSITYVLQRRGVVEGGTGEMKRERNQ